MKRILITLSLTILAVVALLFLLSFNSSAESGWPINTAGEPSGGGSWQGTGQLEEPAGPGGDPPAKHADWYNETNGNIDWTIGSGENILRSYSAFDFKHDLIIESGGSLHLDSVTFIVNVTENDHKIWIKPGGSLTLSNSSFFGIEIYVEGKLNVSKGNQTSNIAMDVQGAPGIIIKSGSDVEIMDSYISGETTLVTVEDSGAQIYENTFSTREAEAACILLKDAAEIHNNSFIESAPGGSYAIIAEEGVNSKIYGNIFDGFKYGSTYEGRAILSYGPLEIFDNKFTNMRSGAEDEPYMIYFVGVEPTDHDGEPVWETNRFRGDKPLPNQHRVNIFKQTWNVEVTVLNKYSDNPIEGAHVEMKNNNDFVVSHGYTDASGKISLEVPEIYVTANNDGDEGDTPKTPRDNNLFTVFAEAMKAGQSNSTALTDQEIRDNIDFELKLDLVEFDFGVSDIDIEETVTAGETVTLKATVFNNGYDRETTVPVDFSIVDGARGEWSLGTVNVLVEYDFVFASLDADIPLSYARTDVQFKAETKFEPADQDGNPSNNVFTSENVHVNEKPIVVISEPGEGDTVEGEVNITGTAMDDDTVNLVMVNITGQMDWSPAVGKENWYFILNTKTLGIPNGDYEIKAMARDNNMTFSLIAVVNVTLENAPIINVYSPVDGAILRGTNSVTMLGETEQLDAVITRVTVAIDEGEEINASKTQADWSQWNFPLKTVAIDRLNDLSDGPHEFVATVYDADGLSNSITVNYIVYSTAESTNPTVTIESYPDEITGDAWVEGTVTDDYKVVDMKYRINQGDWKNVTEGYDLQTDNASFRISVNPAMFEEGNNFFEVRGYDDDGNATAAVNIIGPAIGEVDLFIKSVTLQDESGNPLKKDDLSVNKIIKVIVNVGVDTQDTIPQVAVRISIGGLDAATEYEPNVTADFPITFSFKLTKNMEGKDTYSIIVDPAKIIAEKDETNNEESGDLPGKIGGGGNGDDDDGGGFLPGFELVALVTGMTLAGIIAKKRKRRG